MADFHEARKIYFEIPDLLVPWPVGVHLRSSGSLEAELPPALWTALKSKFPEVFDLDRYSIEGLGRLLAPRPHIEFGLTGPGIDHVLFALARTAAKEISGFETMDDQMRALFGSCGDETLKNLTKLLTEPAYVQSRARALHEALASGDESRLAQQRSAAEAAAPRRTKLMFDDRELKWVPQIVNIAAFKRPTFIAVGALHFPGPNGLLALLRACGFEFDRPGF